MKRYAKITDNKYRIKLQKPEAIGLIEGFTKAYPKTKLKFSNSFGNIFLESFEVELNNEKEWMSLQFFFKKLLPLITFGEEIKPEKKPERSYAG